MNIQAAKNLFSTTFGKKAAASKQRVIPVSPVSPEQNAFPPSTSPTYNFKGRSSANVHETTASVKQSAAPVERIAPVVLEHRSDRVSRFYLNVAEDKDTKYQVDTFA